MTPITIAIARQATTMMRIPTAYIMQWRAYSRSSIIRVSGQEQPVPL